MSAAWSAAESSPCSGLPSRSLSHGAAPVAFAIAGLIALVTVYSYVKLSLRYPSEGGTIEFIVQGMGNGLFSALVNNLLLISYVIMLALYAYAFGSYGSALILGHDVAWLHKALAAGVIVLFASVNLMGSFMTGKTEDVMVFIKLAILLVFAGVGFTTIDVSRLEPATWTSPTSIVTGGLMIFLCHRHRCALLHPVLQDRAPKSISAYIDKDLQTRSGNEAAAIQNSEKTEQAGDT